MPEEPKEQVTAVAFYMTPERVYRMKQIATFVRENTNDPLEALMFLNEIKAAIEETFGLSKSENEWPHITTAHLAPGGNA